MVPLSKFITWYRKGTYMPKARSPIDQGPNWVRHLRMLAAMKSKLS